LPSLRGFVSHKPSTPKVLNNDRPPLPTALVDRRTPGLFHCEGW
jgi:hypothetical protein